MAAAKKKPIKTGASRGHITNLKQSILETFDIYGRTLGKYRSQKSPAFLPTRMRWNVARVNEAQALKQIGDRE
jgi:hypothetical protein